MPPAYVKTIQDEIYYECARLMTRAVYNTFEREIVEVCFQKLKTGVLKIEDIIADWEAKKKRMDLCAFCGRATNMETGHLIPRPLGGEDTVDNVVNACKACNALRGDKRLFEWMGLKQKDFVNCLILGRYLKQLLALHTKMCTLGVEKNDVPHHLCLHCALESACKKHGTEHELTCLCLESVL